MTRPVDDAVHRCPGCGAWLYDMHPCTCCAALAAARGDAS